MHNNLADRFLDLGDVVAVRRERLRAHTKVTYTCGHTTDFIESPPRVGDRITCRICLKDIFVVTATHVGRQGNRTKVPEEENV